VPTLDLAPRRRSLPFNRDAQESSSRAGPHLGQGPPSPLPKTAHCRLRPGRHLRVRQGWRDNEVGVPLWLRRTPRSVPRGPVPKPRSGRQRSAAIAIRDRSWSSSNSRARLHAQWPDTRTMTTQRSRDRERASISGSRRAVATLGTIEYTLCSLRSISTIRKEHEDLAG